MLHSCHNPSCVNPEHLRWGTQAENMQDCKQADRIRNQHGRPKLTDDQVREVRRRYVRGTGLYNRGNRRELAAEFGVAPRTINHVVSGINRGDVQ